MFDWREFHKDQENTFCFGFDAYPNQYSFWKTLYCTYPYLYYLWHAGGHSTFFGLLNTFVHIIMYAYYLLAALGPNVQKYLWWKKYLTSLQMVQFLAIMIHAFQLLFIDCDYPKAFVWWIGMHAVMFFFLFKEFYKQQYQKPSKEKVIIFLFIFYFLTYCKNKTIDVEESRNHVIFYFKYVVDFTSWKSFVACANCWNSAEVFFCSNFFFFCLCLMFTYSSTVRVLFNRA